jgi:hypothetical protein
VPHVAVDSVHACVSAKRSSVTAWRRRVIPKPAELVLPTYNVQTSPVRWPRASHGQVELDEAAEVMADAGLASTEQRAERRPVEVEGREELVQKTSLLAVSGG